MSNKNLSPRQKQIYDFIADYVRENGFPPSISEIGNNFLISNSSTYTHLTLMKKKGWITSRENVPRSFRLVQGEEHGKAV